MNAGDPDLRFGAFYWIPDEDSGIGTRQRHPFVIVRSPIRGDPIALASPRTTSDMNASDGRGLIIPRGVLPGFTLDGMVYVGRVFRYPSRNFRHWGYMGRLSPEWLSRLRASIDEHRRRFGGWSEGRD